MSTRWSFTGVFSISAGLTAALLTGCSSNTSSVEATDTATANTPAVDATPLVVTPSTATSKGRAARGAAKGIVWQPTYKEAWSKAYLAKKPLMIDFYADWCQPCKMMDNQTYPNAAVAKAASQFTSVKVDIDKETELAQKYKVTGLPTVMWLNNKGEIIHKIEGFRSPSDFVNEMKIAQSRFSPIS